MYRPPSSSDQGTSKRKIILIRIIIAVLLMICTLCGSYFVYQYRMNSYDLNDENENTGASEAKHHDQEHSHESNVWTVQSDSKESDEYENKGQSEYCNTDFSQNKVTRIRLESMHETQESVLADIQLIKEQMKELREEQGLKNFNISEPEVNERFLEALQKDISARFNVSESLVLKIEKKLADLSTTFSEFNIESNAGLEILNLSLSSLKNDTNNNVSEIHNSLKEIHKQEAVLEGKVQNIVADIIDIKETGEGTNARITDLLALHPNTINKSLVTRVFLGIFCFTLFLIYFVYFKVRKEMDTTLREDLESTIRKKLETTLREELEAALRKELEHLKPVRTNNTEVNEVTGKRLQLDN